MSLGGVIGGVVGGVVGFFIGGPMGAVYGAGIGFTAGLFFDPITPDVPASGGPAPGTQVMQSTVGDPIPDLNGTAMITGHLLLFGKERTEEIVQTQETQGGKGGEPEPQSQVVGHKYYMSWAVGIVKGPITKLLAVYKNDVDILWEGELFCPVSGGQETIVLTGMGSCTFYFGTDDQVANTKVGEIVDSTLNSPLRGFCWAFMDDCYIGDYNRTPSLKFVVSKQPDYSFFAPSIIQEFDYNPMHSIWHILNQMTGLPEAWLNETDFASVAATLLAEYRGISILFDKQQSALYYLEMINAHIDGVLRYGSDGKFHPKLIRNDYVVGTLPLIDESVLLDEPTLNRGSWIDTLNEIKVQYTELLNAPRSKYVEFEDAVAVDCPVPGWDIAWALLGGSQGMFVLVYSQYIYTSIDGGNTWVQQLSTGNSLHSVLYLNNMFIVVGSYNTLISTDGINWTAGPVLSIVGPQFTTHVSYDSNSGLYICPTTTGGGSSRIWLSGDALNWTFAAFVGSYQQYQGNINFRGKNFIFSNNYTTSYLSEDDDNLVWGLNPNPPDWSLAPTGATRGRAFLNGDLTKMYYSSQYTSNGVDWIQGNIPQFNYGKFGSFLSVFAVISGGQIKISNDAETWVQQQGVITYVPTGIAVGNDRWVAVTSSAKVFIGVKK